MKLGFSVLLASLICTTSFGDGGNPAAALQSLLPPSPYWNDTKSVWEFVWSSEDDPKYMTPAEASDFQETATYEQVTEFFTQLAHDCPFVQLESIATLANGEDFWLVKVSGEQKFSPQTAQDADDIMTNPIIFVTAGSHAGESAGVNAGMMFVRNLVYKEEYKYLLDSVNFLFVPILNIQGYLDQSPYGRMNQHGPNTSGRRANGSWKNLNRDYTKLDTPEVQAVVGVMNNYPVSFYVDIHCTDGMNYQPDVTWCDNGDSGLSSEIYHWLRTEMQPDLESFLQDEYHHKTSVCYAANNPLDPTAGYYPYFTDGAVYSVNYADVRHIPGYLLELHALKPNKQRVLGVHAFLLGLHKIVSIKGDSLQQAIQMDRAARVDPVPVAWDYDSPAPMVEWPIFEYEVVKNPVLGIDQIIWSDIPLTITAEQSTRSVPLNPIKRPYAYVIPAVWTEVIDVLALHGIEMEMFTQDASLEVVNYRTEDAEFVSLWEGRAETSVGDSVTSENCTRTYHKNDVIIKTDQVLGTLAVTLLEPTSESGLFLWGFFNSILALQELPENYIMIPLAEKMLNESTDLSIEWEAYKAENPSYVNDTEGTLLWFFRRSPFYEPAAYLYPVGILYEEPRDANLPLKPFTAPGLQCDEQRGDLAATSRSKSRSKKMQNSQRRNKRRGKNT